LPVLYGELSEAAPERLALTLRVHNEAGVPIAEGHTDVESGSRAFAFRQVRPIGMDAYGHLGASRRHEIALRVWSRRAYGTLRLEAAVCVGLAS
jgi:hypothetical protein